MPSRATIDADGHVFEDLARIGKLMPKEYWTNNAPPSNAFAPLDHMHTALGRTLPGAFGDGKPVNSPEWFHFLEDVGVEATVLYPTAGLAYGRMNDVDWAIAACRAYNDWLHEAYVAKSPRFRGMALIPLQDPDEAVVELRRAVTELKMTGAMLPSTGLKAHLGSKEYWPVYAEAERLGCALALHGGSHINLGFNDLNMFAPIHALGHPYGIMIGFAGIIFNGVLDRFPGVRVGFLEAGVGWLAFTLERFDGSYKAFTPIDLRGQYMQFKSGERKPSHVIRRHIEEGRIFVGVEGDEPTLPHAVKTVGNKPFMFSTDYPHEVTNETCKEEIQELLENEELSDADKEAILYTNAKRFYALGD
ncbi:MAG: amidohydrolase [Dehalococcoidia bacterium]|nr:amidohydrolase [Dehalococcoidia bacterium]